PGRPLARLRPRRPPLRRPRGRMGRVSSRPDRAASSKVPTAADAGGTSEAVRLVVHDVGIEVLVIRWRKQAWFSGRPSAILCTWRRTLVKSHALRNAGPGPSGPGRSLPRPREPDRPANIIS